MKIGEHTFVQVVNPWGKVSEQPLSYVMTFPPGHFKNMDGDVLTWSRIGLKPAIELKFSGPLIRSVHKAETFLTVGPDEVIQGTPARGIKTGQAFKTRREGDARVSNVKGRPRLTKAKKPRKGSRHMAELYDVNVSGTVHGVNINE